MKQRVITGAIFGLLFIPGIIFGGIYFYCLSLIITFVSTFELMNMFYKKNEGLKIVRFIIPIFSILFFSLLNYVCVNDTLRLCISDNGKLKCFIRSSSMLPEMYAGYRYAFTFLFGLLIIVIIAIISIFLKNPGKSAINSIISFVYGGILMSLALNVEYTMALGDNEWFFYKNRLASTSSFAYVYLIVCFSDMFAYFSGYLFGKHKLCPSISPKKTVEGAIGGTLMASIFGTIGAFVFDVVYISSEMSTGTIILIIVGTFIFSVLLSIISQLGDLFASVLKREYEIKDYGNILPGHGGILDRFDSTALAGSAFFICLILIKFIVFLL